MIDTTAVVLAGGRSTRMGRDKRELLIGGEPLLARSVRLMREIFSEVAVSANDRPDGLPEGTRIIPDLVPDLGPLGGIHAALKATEADPIFVTACDVPFPSKELIELLYRESGAASVTLCESDSGLEPLLAFYRHDCLPAVERFIAEGGRQVISLLRRLSVRTLSADDLSGISGIESTFLNVNRPGDLEMALEAAGGFERLDHTDKPSEP